MNALVSFLMMQKDGGRRECGVGGGRYGWMMTGGMDENEREKVKEDKWVLVCLNGSVSRSGG